QAEALGTTDLNGGALFNAEFGIRHRGSTVPERSGVALSFCRRPSLGLSIAYNDRNKGLGKTLLEYGINYLRNSKTVHRVEILVNTENKIAISLYEKNGFKIEAIQKDKVFFMGEYYDASLYSLLLN
ncbi:GNAT family N-acetyltransferase, partial [Pseudomonas aeruginosa]|nr:GNAT family N-acetyltransferase [Pseudomonas aeruginosa]